MEDVGTYVYDKKVSQPLVQTNHEVSPDVANLISGDEFKTRLNAVVKSSQEDRKAPSLRELFRGLQQIVRE